MRTVASHSDRRIRVLFHHVEYGWVAYAAFLTRAAASEVDFEFRPHISAHGSDDVGSVHARGSIVIRNRVGSIIGSSRKHPSIVRALVKLVAVLGGGLRFDFGHWRHVHWKERCASVAWRSSRAGDY